MFTGFFADLRAAKLPVSIEDYVRFLGPVSADMVFGDREGFKSYAHVLLVREDSYSDKFEEIFDDVFGSLEGLSTGDCWCRWERPEDCLRTLAERHLTASERAEVEALGGVEELIKTLARN